MERPVEIKRAAICIGISLILGFVKIALDTQHLASQGIPIAAAFILPSIITAILLFFVYKTYQGRNWARITFLVLTVIGLLPYIPMLAEEFERAVFIGLLSVTQLTLQIFALWLLFSSPGKHWFNLARA